MLMSVGVEVHFDAAHHLPNYDGECKNLHGHTWHIRVEVGGELDPLSGMVIDLKILKKILQQAIQKYDHDLLNHHIGLPTCEVLAYTLASHMYNHTRTVNVIAMGGSKETDIRTIKVWVQEGEGGWACATL